MSGAHLGTEVWAAVAAICAVMVVVCLDALAACVAREKAARRLNVDVERLRKEYELLLPPRSAARPARASQDRPRTAA